MTYDTLRFGEFEDFPETSEPVWILGKEYNALTGGGRTAAAAAAMAPPPGLWLTLSSSAYFTMQRKKKSYQMSRRGCGSHTEETSRPSVSEGRASLEGSGNYGMFGVTVGESRSLSLTCGTAFRRDGAHVGHGMGLHAAVRPDDPRRGTGVQTLGQR